jgi:hypothetical protein
MSAVDREALLEIIRGWRKLLDGAPMNTAAFEAALDMDRIIHGTETVIEADTGARMVGGFKPGDVAVLRCRQPTKGADYLDAAAQLATFSKDTGVHFLLVPYEMELLGPERKDAEPVLSSEDDRYCRETIEGDITALSCGNWESNCQCGACNDRRLVGIWFERLLARDAARVADALPLAPDSLRAEVIRNLWRSYGGNFHGPNAETATMPETSLLRLMRRLLTERYGDEDRAPIVDDIPLPCFVKSENSGSGYTVTLGYVTGEAAHDAHTRIAKRLHGDSL